MTQVEYLEIRRAVRLLSYLDRLRYKDSCAHRSVRVFRETRDACETWLDRIDLPAPGSYRVHQYESRPVTRDIRLTMTRAILFKEPGVYHWLTREQYNSCDNVGRELWVAVSSYSDARHPFTSRGCLQLQSAPERRSLWRARLKVWKPAGFTS
jgi:hypothetical protein